MLRRLFFIVFCRYQMFLQLKLDMLSGRLQCSDDVAADLSALALQCQSVRQLVSRLYSSDCSRCISKLSSFTIFTTHTELDKLCLLAPINRSCVSVTLYAVSSNFRYVMGSAESEHPYRLIDLVVKLFRTIPFQPM